MFANITKSFGLRKFARQEEGSVSLEAMILMPMVIWVFAAMFSIFETYEEYSLNQKAAYTIGDMISRETLPIDAEYLNGAQDLLDYITNSQEQSTLRVTSLKYDGYDKRFYVHWSQSRGPGQPATDSDVASWTDRLPTITDNEYIVVTETMTTFSPPFNIGLGKPDIENFIFTRARYAPRVLFTGS
jgi:Flp pilus assembly protein TadG